MIAQTVFILLTLMYAFVQKAEAVKQAKVADEQRKIAEQNARIAQEAMIRLESACK